MLNIAPSEHLDLGRVAIADFEPTEVLKEWGVG
jgi:hypothetical protein